MSHAASSESTACRVGEILIMHEIDSGGPPPLLQPLSPAIAADHTTGEIHRIIIKIKWVEIRLGRIRAHI